MTSKFHSIEEAATLFEVHYSTVWEWLQAGRLPAIKVGGRWRISDADMAAFIDETTNKALAKGSNK